MRHMRALFYGSLLLAAGFAQKSIAQSQPGPTATPNIQVTSRLVFLDITVLNKAGQPVVDGLTKEDFAITEDKRPQHIFSFEAPGARKILAQAKHDNPGDRVPMTIFVLDLLNSSFEDFAFIRYSVRNYLTAQPALLISPVEMMVLGNQSLQLLQGPTRNKADLLDALDRLPPAIPYKWQSGSFIEERFDQSVDALRQIALQNQGVPGRKNVVWVGHGSPSFTTMFFTEPLVHDLEQYMHATTNMLVDARVTLFVIYPGLEIGHLATHFSLRSLPISAGDAQARIDNNHPFEGDINFGVFVNETGGKLFYNRNDVDAAIARSQLLGANYYTLTYQPSGGNADGKFRRIRITLRNPDLQAITKTGYYAPDKGVPINPGQQTNFNLAEAAHAIIPFEALNVKVTGMVRHPESQTADITLLLSSKGIDWQASENGKSAADITLAAASLTGSQAVLASKSLKLTLNAPTEDPTRLANLVTPLKIMVGVPRKTRSIRVVVETASGGRMGAVDLDRKAIDSAPAAPASNPPLLCRPPCPAKLPIPVTQ